MNKFKHKSSFFITVLITAILLCLSLFGLKFGTFHLKGADEMRFGIDIRGGVEATYEAKDLDRAPTKSELEAAQSVLETRMDALNITDREVTSDVVGGKIIVRFPWKSDETDFDPEQAVSELGETARLTFQDPDGNVVLEGTDVTHSSAQLSQSTGKPVVELELSDEGSEKFEKATKELVGQRISIYMDETLISAPTVQSAITGKNVEITNLESLSSAKELSDKINSGSLPFSLVVKNCNIISPTLGTGALSVMVRAGEVAFILVCLFMLLYYRLPGLVACIALLLQVVGQLLALSIPQFTLTLPGIAGIILSVGMGVDANVIVSERIKEEINDGKTLRAAIDAGFHKAFSSVFDGNITVIIVAVMLLIFGSGATLSFGYTLLFGVFMNFIAGITASRIMIMSLSQFRFLQKPSLYGYRKDYKEHRIERIHFFKRRVVFFVISAVVLLSGVVAGFLNGVQLDIQFKGGTILKYTYTGTIDTEEVDDLVENILGQPANCQIQYNMAKDEQMLIVSLTENASVTSQEQQKVSDALIEKYPDQSLSLSESLTVEPFVGARFFRNGITAIFISFLLILLYVAVRFRKIGGFSAGTMALIALVHDALVVSAAFIVFKIPLSDAFITSILTIIGFSINDTIVIYDRIRENRTLLGSKVSPEELVDVSITQSMTRSINTNIAVFLSITVCFIFAAIYDIESIREFALPMMFGTVSGCYSTICIAGPLWTMWKNHKLKPKTERS